MPVPNTVLLEGLGQDLKTSPGNRQLELQTGTKRRGTDHTTKTGDIDKPSRGTWEGGRRFAFLVL